MSQVTPERGDEPQPERHEPDRAETGDGGDRREDQRFDRDAEPRLAGRRLVGQDLEGPEQHRAEERRRDDPDERRLEQPRQPDDGDRDEGQVAARRAIVHRRDGTRAVHTRPGLPAAQASRSARDRVLTTTSGGDPGAARLADPPADVVELVEVVRVGVDGEHAAERDGPAGPLDGQVETRRRPVHLERRAGPRRLGVDEVPVEVEVVARPDLPSRRVGDDVDVRAADRVERPLRSAPPAVWRRDTWTDATTTSKRASRSSSKSSRPSARISSSQPWRRRKPSAGVSGGAVPAASSAAKPGVERRR